MFLRTNKNGELCTMESLKSKEPFKVHLIGGPMDGKEIWCSDKDVLVLSFPRTVFDTKTMQGTPDAEGKASDFADYYKSSYSSNVFEHSKYFANQECPL